MDSSKRKFPVTLMFDADRHSKLEAVSRVTRVSKSELVRLSVDQLMANLGNPDSPDLSALAKLLKAKDDA